MNSFEFKANRLPNDLMLAECDLSTRAFVYLKNLGINKLGDLLSYTEEELRAKMPMVNNKTFQELQDLLDKYNLNFKQPE